MSCLTVYRQRWLFQSIYSYTSFLNYLDELIRPVPSGENEDIFPIPSFGVRQVVCQWGIGDSLSTSRKLICRVLEENGQDSWPASRDIDLPQPPKQSLTCFPCPYFILCSLMLVLFDISFISMDPNFDTLLGVLHKHRVVPEHPDLTSSIRDHPSLPVQKIAPRCLYS